MERAVNQGYNRFMRLSETLFEILIKDDHSFISITGGGGKTTLLSLLGRRCAENGKSVLLTTTTKVASPYLHDYDADRIFEDESVLGYAAEKGKVCFYAEHHTLDMKKWIAPREDVLSILASRFDVVLAEADGSKGLPLKIHTERDPVINKSTTALVAIMGLWGIGKKAYSEAFGEDRDIMIDKAYLQWYLKCPEGLSKGFSADNIILFNGAEAVSEETVQMLSSLDYPEHTRVFAVSEKEDRIYGTIC